jgi:uncharacterized OsmC-like protein
MEGATDMAFDEKTGKLTVSVSLREGEGRRVVGDARGHELATDVYAAWGGTDTAPTPLETLAFALGSCVVTTARAMANKAGLPVSSISATVEGAIDTAASRRPESGVRMGFPGLSVVVDIEGDLPDDKKQAMLDRVVACCPVCDTIGGGSAVSVVMKGKE